MKVLYFHQHFSTPQGSSGSRSYEFARALLAAGHQVTMVCGSAQLAALKLPYHPQEKWSRGQVDGIDIISLPLDYSNRDSIAKRSLTFLCYAWRSIEIALTMDFDLAFATSTPLTVAIPGMAARWLRGKPFVFEARDLWPELPKALGLRNPLLLGGMNLLEWSAYQSAHALVGLSPGIVAGMQRRSQPGKPIAMIPNGCDLGLFVPGSRQNLELPGIEPDDFVAAFTGAHGIANGLDAVLSAAAVLKERGNRQIKLLFIGDGKEKERLAIVAQQRGLDNCLFFDPVPKTALAPMVGGLNCGLMVLKNVPAFYYGTSPNKFFDYISAGIPVLNNYPGWLADLINEHQCGLAIPPDNPVAFADALETLAADPEGCKVMGQNARQLAASHFDRDQLSKEFVTFLEEQYQLSRASLSTSAQTKRSKSGGQFYRHTAKRALDLLITIPLLILLAPLLLVLALLVRFKLGAPVLFSQQRPGRNGRPFVMYKFRTMTDQRDKQGKLLPDAQRMTPLGRMLRSTSLDELPELFNVLRGEMSLVGPRPLLMQYLDRYTPEQARRHEVRPGITGWAQVNGRNALSWEEKFKLDVWYVDNVSFWFDLRILFSTLWKVIAKEGISQAGQATTGEFMGNGQ